MKPSELATSLALAPHMLDFTPKPDTLLVVGYQPGELADRAVVVANATATAENLRLTNATIAAPDFLEGVGEIRLVAYGPKAEQLLKQLDDFPPSVSVIHSTVHDGLMRTKQGTEWSQPEALPEVDLAAAVGESQRPAPELMTQQYGPAKTSTYEALSAHNVAQFEAMPPTFRAEVATRTLDSLALPGVRQDPAKLATLAHLVTDDVFVRDSIITHAAGDRAATDTLFKLYRGAPGDLSTKLASTAAATALMSETMGTAGVLEVVSHSDDRLGQLVNATVAAGVPTESMRKEFSTIMDDPKLGLNADEKWSRGREAATTKGPSIKSAGTSKQRKSPTVAKQKKSPTVAKSPTTPKPPLPGINPSL